MRWILLFFCAFYCFTVFGTAQRDSVPVSASDTVKLSQLNRVLGLNSYISALSTECQACEIQSVITRLADFSPLNNLAATSARNTYWLHFTLRNDLDSNVVVLFRVFPWNESIKGYFFNEEQAIPHTIGSGSFVKAGLRSVGFSEQLLKYNFPKNTSVSVFLKIQNTQTTYAPQLNVTLLSELRFKQFESNIRFADTISIAFQGAVWVMLLFMFLVFLQSREKVYLYYSLYLMFIMVYLSTKIYSDALVNYPFREWPELKFYLNYPIQLLFYVAYNKFICSFLELKTTDHWLFKKVKQLNIVFTAVMLAGLFYLLLSGNGTTLDYVWTAIAFLMILIYLAMLVRIAIYIKTPYARFMVVGMLFFMVGAVICVLMNRFISIPTRLSNFNILEIGLFCEILCFSMGLGYKMWQTSKDKYMLQKAYINELQRNEAIIQETNLQLEQKVKERSAELVNKTIELERQKQQTLATEYEQKIALAEMSALRAQMNPHFLFNCMSTLESFILENNEVEASDFLGKFSKLLRLILENSRQLRVEVADDIHALRLYLQLEQVRFENRFAFDIKLAPQLSDGEYYIPPLIIQPFVENAVVHGIFNKPSSGNIRIELKLIGNRIRCSVEDNGIGRKKALEIGKLNKPHHKSLGLKVTHERIEVLNHIHKSKATISTLDLVDNEGEPIGTRVEIDLPLL